MEPGGTNRFDPCHASGVRAFDTFTVKAVVHRGIIHAGTNTTTYWTFHATWRSLGLKSGVMHRICPSMTRTYDSVRSKDAVQGHVLLVPRVPQAILQGIL